MLILALVISLTLNVALITIILRAGRRWRDLRDMVRAHRLYVPDHLYPKPGQSVSEATKIFQDASRYWCRMVTSFIDGHTSLQPEASQAD